MKYNDIFQGYSSTVVVNSKLTQGKRDFLKYYGATIEQIGDFTISGPTINCIGKYRTR